MLKYTDSEYDVRFNITEILLLIYADKVCYV
jgi:hypothetical protein